MDPVAEEVQPGAAEVIEAKVTGSEEIAPGPAAEITDDEEPGGESPEAVFARKQYRAAKKAREEADTERVARARLEGELRALREQQQRPVVTGRREYTKAELDAAVADGTLDLDEANDIFFKQKYRKFREEEKAVEARTEPLKKAKADVDTFMGYFPELSDTASDLRRRADAEADRLVAEFGYERDVRLAKLAIENTVGTLTAVKAKRESDRLTRQGSRPAPADTGAGGGHGGGSGNGAVDLSKATPRMKAYWEDQKVPVKSREREMREYNRIKGQMGG